MTALLFFTSFLYYLAGLNGTVPAYRDSGDLIATIHSLGIAHPPGYALYVLVGKVFVTILPFGNVAYRVNVMSAVFAALAACILYQVFVKITRDQLSSLIVTVLLALTPAMTALARVAEMYTFSAFLTVLILCCLLSDDPNGPSWAALFLGLGLSVHLTLLFLFPLFLVSPRRDISRSSVLCFALGLCIFLYLPARALQDPVINWGDPSNWRNFWRVITRADYGGLKLHPEESVLSWTPGQIFHQSLYFITSFAKNWSWGAFALGIFGAARMFRDPPKQSWGVGVLAAWLLSGPIFFVLSNLPLTEATTPAILQPYLIIPTLLWSIFTAAGLAASLAYFPSKKWVMAMIMTVVLGARAWAWESSRYDFYAYDYARNLLQTMPKDAVLYDPDDTTHFSIQVLQLLENRRPDVMLLSFFRTRWGYEQLKHRWPEFLPPLPMRTGQELQRALWNYSALKRPFFAELPQKFPNQSYKSFGLLYAQVHEEKELSSVSSRKLSEEMLDQSLCRGSCVTTAHKDFFIRHTLGYYAAARCNLGLEYASKNDWANAIRSYQLALEIDPELSAAWNNWGIALFNQGDMAGAAKLFQQGLALDPKNEMLQKNAQLAISPKKTFNDAPNQAK